MFSCCCIHVIVQPLRTVQLLSLFFPSSLSFCLKPLHSHRALHVCSHDNLSSRRSSSSSSLLTLSPLTLGEGEDTEREGALALPPAWAPLKDAQILLPPGPPWRRGCFVCDVMETPSKSKSYLFTAQIAGGDKHVAQSPPEEEEASRF